MTSAQALQYNNAPVEAYERIGKAMLAFGKAAGDALEGRTIEVAMAKREHENLADAIGRTRANIPAQRAFAEAHGFRLDKKK